MASFGHWCRRLCSCPTRQCSFSLHTTSPFLKVFFSFKTARDVFIFGTVPILCKSDFWSLLLKRFSNFIWIHHWRNCWISSGSTYRFSSWPPLTWSSVSSSNRIASTLASRVLHATVLSFMLMCWHYLWIQKQVHIRQSLASW